MMGKTEGGGSTSPPNTTTSSDGAESSQFMQKASEPDADTIKMFVGQVPRHWGEKECRDLFEEYGPVYQLNVLRDRATQLSRGCCFVTYYHRKDAIAAQSAMHNVRMLDGMHHAVQMKPADMENRNDRKIFIGMLNKKMNENDIRNMFTKYGTIEDCMVLRDNDGKSRGCAFVTYASRAQAQLSIRHMHQAHTMEGCNLPIVVKFADAQRKTPSDGAEAPSSTPAMFTPQPTQPAYLDALANPWAAPTLTNTPLMQQLAAINPQYVLLLQQAQALQRQQAVAAAMALTPQQQQLIAIQQLLQQNTFVPGPSVASSQSGDMTTIYNATMAQQQPAATTPYTTVRYAANQPPPTNTNVGHANLLAQQQAAMNQQNAAAALMQNAWAGLQQYNVAINQQQSATYPLMTSSDDSTSAGQREGPQGSNLFIYHLPQEFTDTELANTFMPFGQIVSAKVFVDKVTNLSKCFGFVSYDNATSANAAISAMNGFQIGTKRLKVQLKKSKEEMKPYVQVKSDATANGSLATV